MSDGLKELLLRATSAQASAPAHMLGAERRIRILLIQPPSTEGVQSLLPQVDNDGGEGIGFKPPLGLLYVATTVSKWSNHEVKVVDAQAERLGYEDLRKIAAEFQPDLVGISAWTDFWYPAYRTGQAIKQALPNAHLTYGGPHLGIYPAETLEVDFIDSVIVGDGEIPFLYLANMIANRVVDNSLPGLHFKQGGVKKAPDLFFIEGDLNRLPLPDRELLPIRNYGSVLGNTSYVTTMITSRGCPHKCTFCKLNFQKNVARSAESVVEEFRQIAALGIKEVEVYDDTFTWSRKRLVEICDALIAADLGVEWAIRDRVSSQAVDGDLMERMYKAGCRRIHFGIESGVQHVIDRMKKRITLQQAVDAVDAAKKAGMTVLTYFMFGNLEETVADMRTTIDFALTLNADFAQFSITIPYAGTEMYDEARKSGHISTDYWGEYASNPTPDFLPPQLIEEHADLKTLLEIRDEAVRRFYFRPKYIIRSIGELRSFGEFVRKARMGMQLALSVYTK
ncbi:MAG: radical SAM protein [Proteobacteria bacterium]|nr:radical SAM protein [Pseudomonadota bacterium]